MKSCPLNINAFFCAALLALALCACKTTEQKKAEKEKTLISLHIETNPDGSQRNSPVPVYRTRPQYVNVMTQPFLANDNIASASIVELQGGFGIQLKFDRAGSRILELTTARNRGRRIAINCAFPELRWLAAPRIANTITDGILIFTPDATREESERIVLGLNNVAKKTRKDPLI